MSRGKRGRIERQLAMMFVDAVLLLCCGALSRWIVPVENEFVRQYTALASLGLLCSLFVSRFYRVRISEGSLDLVNRALAGFLSGVLLSIFVPYYKYGASSPWIPYFTVFWGSSFLALMFVRFFYRSILQQRSTRINNGNPRAVIYGAGALGGVLIRQYQKGKLPYHIVALIDDNKALLGTDLLGVKIRGTIDDLSDILVETNAKTLIIAITQIEQEKMFKAIDAAQEVGVDVKVIPSLFELQEGAKEFDLRNLDYADLLGRQLIQIDKKPIQEMVCGKRVLVTGAGGSIGSEICRQLLSYGPAMLILLDIDETELHDISLRLHNYQREWSDLIVPVVCDIKNRWKVDRIMERYKPELVFHAAAYKHVPLQELYPEEAITTNILGSYAVLKSAREHGVQKVVVISTDKAVNPTNVMGATKRVVELIAGMLSCPNTEMVCVRFGNVLGSRGSMLPLFMEQIKAGVPITVTHKDINRYFMAIPEAVGLVFKAASMAKGGEVMVLDMGQPVKIYDFAQKLVKYYGDGRSQVIVTGLRPGEKLYEELLADKDSTIPTEDRLVYKARLNNTELRETDFIESYVPVFQSGDPKEMVGKLHDLVPEYKNGNS